MKVEYSVDSNDSQRKNCSYQGAHIGRKDSEDVPSSLPASTRGMTVIFELRLKILQPVHDTFTEVSKNKTLLALALTCKLFTGPALNLVCDLAPLINGRCLPQMREARCCLSLRLTLRISRLTGAIRKLTSGSAVVCIAHSMLRCEVGSVARILDFITHMQNVIRQGRVQILVHRG
jgi:hypothetical protein